MLPRCAAALQIQKKLQIRTYKREHEPTVQKIKKSELRLVGKKTRMLPPNTNAQNVQIYASDVIHILGPTN